MLLIKDINFIPYHNGVIPLSFVDKKMQKTEQGYEPTQNGTVKVDNKISMAYTIMMFCEIKTGI